MAAPSEVTTKALSGKYLMNKDLSDSSEEILRLQGVSWVKRRTISQFALTITLKHTTDEAGMELIDIDQSLSGYFSSHLTRTLDWQEREQQDETFGFITERARRIPVEEITDETLKKDWSQDTLEHDVVLTETWSTPGKNSEGWKVQQAWGFAEIDGIRRHVRYTTLTSEKENRVVHARLVYDYVGPLA